MISALRPTVPPLPGLSQEHGALLRRLAHLQERVTVLMHTQDRTVARLEQEILRLRASLIVTRTAAFWGLASATTACPPRTTRAQTTPERATAPPPFAQAHQVLCLTACSGHAHPWLQDDGQCQRTGQACDHLNLP